MSIERMRGRVDTVEAVLKEQGPFRAPTAVQWYAEDVPRLLDEIEALEAERDEIMRDSGWTAQEIADAYPPRIPKEGTF